MARDYALDDFKSRLESRRHNISVGGVAFSIAALIFCSSSLSSSLSASSLALIGGLMPFVCVFLVALVISNHRWIERERRRESERRGNKPVLGLPPNRRAFEEALKVAQKQGKAMIDRYLVGFELDSGAPIWVTDEEMTGHGAVFAKTGVGKTLWLEGLMFQQMARARASGFTFIDAKRDPGTLADIIMMALITGRIEDLIIIDPFDPVCSYNFVFTTQRADVKARKILRCGLPPTSDQSTTKHYDRLAADAVYRVVRAMESLGLAWSVRDIAVALSAFTVAYPRMRELLHEQGAKQAMVELGHLASSYRTAKGSLDGARLTDNLRGIASELHSIANSEAGEMFCVPRADLSLTDAILRGKLIYYMLPRLEEAESAARMVKVFREDLEVSIGEVTSSRTHNLEDPHLVIIDEGASTFGPTWANLFELARKGRFSLLFGAQSISGLMDAQMGLSQEFYDRVIANVNLKVIMRIGDNRTAEDMAEWIGKVNITKKTVSSALSTSLNARELTKHIEFNKRTADGFRDGYTFSEDEKDLVSADELKHEMSAEKGLAWFDKGDGRLRKGRAIWFDGDMPSTWEGREFLTRYENVEADEIGLAEWVDEHILSVERSETRRDQEMAAQANGGSGNGGHSGHGQDSSSNQSEKKEEPAEESGPFRLNLLKGFRGMGRARTVITDPPPAAPPTTTGNKPSGRNEPNEPIPVEKTTGKAVEKSLEAKDVAESPPQAEPAAEGPANPVSGGNPPPTVIPKPEAKKRPGLNFRRDRETEADIAPTSPPSRVSSDSTVTSGMTSERPRSSGRSGLSFGNSNTHGPANQETNSASPKPKRKRKRKNKGGGGSDSNATQQSAADKSSPTSIDPKARGNNELGDG